MFAAYSQDTFGFQFAYSPLGFSRHAHTCSAQTLNVVFHWKFCPNSTGGVSVGSPRARNSTPTSRIEPSFCGSYITNCGAVGSSVPTLARLRKGKPIEPAGLPEKTRRALPGAPC